MEVELHSCETLIVESMSVAYRPAYLQQAATQQRQYEYYSYC